LKIEKPKINGSEKTKDHASGFKAGAAVVVKPGIKGK